jgi:probable DNA metabolism protein
MTILFYDNTLEGFLTAVFEVFEYKYLDVTISGRNKNQKFLFSEPVHVITNFEKSDRVLARLVEQLGKDGVRQLLYAFLSELDDIENILFRAIKYAVDNPTRNVLKDFSNADILQISKLVKSVGREKHRMEAFIRFELLNDGIFFAKIYPDFNVLTLIIRHFKNRYQDQKWLIYDCKRDYGAYYDLENIEIVTFDNQAQNKLKNDETIFDEREINYQKLWAEYFDHTNIKERKNTKLHLQHVPKRYWKYLTEKKLL